MPILDFLAVAWMPDDPHIKRLIADGKRISADYIKDQRSRLTAQVFDDPIANIEFRALKPYFPHFSDPISGRIVMVRC